MVRAVDGRLVCAQRSEAAAEEYRDKRADGMPPVRNPAVGDRTPAADMLGLQAPEEVVKRWLSDVTLGDVLHLSQAFSVVVIVTMIGDPKGNVVDVISGSILLAGCWELVKTLAAAVMLAALTARGRRHE